MNVYCDESGYTGNDLLNRDQPFFVYSAVSSSDEELINIKDYIYSNYNIQNNEIKGKILVKTVSGKKVIKHIFKNYAHKARIIVHHKKYALAAKIVEYAVEPYLKSNYWFYKSGLNNFIATGLYLAFITNEKSAETLFKDFSNILRNKVHEKENFFNKYSKENPLIEWILELIATNPSRVWAEIQQNQDGLKWILDLTNTSLLGLLSEWGKFNEPLRVICDNSKSLVDDGLTEILQGINSRKANIFGTFIGYQLDGKILYEDSKNNLGIQIADLFSSTVFYCLKNKDEDFSKKILKIVYANCICTPNSFCVIPSIMDENEYKKNKQQIESYLIYMEFILLYAKQNIDNF